MRYARLRAHAYKQDAAWCLRSDALTGSRAPFRTTSLLLAITEGNHSTGGWLLAFFVAVLVYGNFDIILDVSVFLHDVLNYCPYTRKWNHSRVRGAHA